jgi:hypothetical protein
MPWGLAITGIDTFLTVGDQPGGFVDFLAFDLVVVWVVLTELIQAEALLFEHRDDVLRLEQDLFFENFFQHHGTGASCLEILNALQRAA